MACAPRIGFVVPVYRPPLDVFDAMLRSVRAQSVPDWECILVDDGSDDPELSRRLAEAADDQRFRVVVAERNGGIAAATNLGLAALRAPVFALADHDDLLSFDAAEAVLTVFDNDPGVGVLYSDESTVDAHGHVIATHRKPDFSPIRLLGQHYLNHLMAARTELIGELQVRTEYEPTQDLDFVVRLIESAERVGQRADHVARTLYGWRAIEGSSAVDVAEKPGMVNAALRSFQTVLERRGVNVEISNAFDVAGRLTATCLLEFPMPSGDHIDLVPIDGRDAADVVSALAGGGARFAALVPVINAAPDDWARVVASEAARDGVGAAGPCLIDEAGRVVSTGRVVVPTLSDLFAGSTLDDGPFGANQATRETTALSPAGMVIDREAFESAGIDFSLDADATWATSLDVIVAAWGIKLQRSGQRLIWTPRTRLVVPEQPNPANTPAWNDWVDAYGQPDEPFSPGGAVSPSGARRSRRERLARSLTPDACLVATDAALIASPEIATTVTEASAAAAVIVVADRSSAHVPAGVGPKVDHVQRLDHAVSAAIDRVAGSRRAAVVVAADPDELSADPRLVRPLVTGGTQGAIDEVALVPVTPFPWPDWFDWSDILVPESQVAEAVTARIRRWLFELGTDEPDPNAQIGVALGPILIASILAVLDAADRAGVVEIALSGRLGVLGEAIDRWVTNPVNERTHMQVRTAADASRQSMFVGWDVSDRPAADCAAIWLVGDRAQDPPVVFDIGPLSRPAGESPNGAVLTSEGSQILSQFLGAPEDTTDQDGRSDSRSPELDATRRVALRCVEGGIDGDQHRDAFNPSQWAVAAAQLTERLARCGRAEIVASLALWWDRRFDGPVPRWVSPHGWNDRFAVASGGDRAEMVPDVAGPVPLWLAKRVLETDRGRIVGQTVAMLATFERGRAEPVDDQRVTYGSATLWQRHRYRAHQTSLRAVAFGAAVESGRVELATFRVLVVAGDSTRELDLLPLLDSTPAPSQANVVWVDTRPLDGTSWLQQAGGQLVVELHQLGDQLFDGLDTDPAPTVELEVEFRFERVGSDNPAFAERFAAIEQSAGERSLPAATAVAGRLFNRLRRRA